MFAHVVGELAGLSRRGVVVWTAVGRHGVRKLPWRVASAKLLDEGRIYLYGRTKSGAASTPRFRTCPIG